MKTMSMLAMTAMLVLAACDRIPFLQGDDGSAAGNVAIANGSANASADANASAGISSSRSLAGLSGNGGEGGKDPVDAVPVRSAIDPRIVGRWSDSGDCKDAGEFRADGVFIAPNGGGAARWQVEGNELVVTGAGGVVRLTIVSVDPDRLVIINPQGQTGQSTRC